MTKHTVTIIYQEDIETNVGDIRGASIKLNSVDKPIVIRIRPRLEDPVKVKEVTKNVNNIKFRNKEHAAAVVRKILKGGVLS